MSQGKTKLDSKEKIPKSLYFERKIREKRLYIFLFIYNSFTYLIKILAEKGKKTSKRYIQISIFFYGLFYIIKTKFICMYMYMYNISTSANYLF